MAHHGPQCPEPVQFPREGIDHAQQRSNAARQHLASGMCCAAGKKRHALENSRSSAPQLHEPDRALLHKWIRRTEHRVTVFVASWNR
jgi:hypothetical protein